MSQRAMKKSWSAAAPRMAIIKRARTMVVPRLM